MRHLGSSALFLVAAAAFAALHVAQGAPQQPAAASASPCYTLALYKIPDQNNMWARILAGGEWITGCLGPAGQCAAPVWILC